MTEAFDEEAFQKLVNDRLEAYKAKEAHLCERKKLDKSDAKFQEICDCVTKDDGSIKKNAGDVAQFLKKQGRPGLKLLRKQLLAKVPQPLPDLTTYLDNIQGEYIIRCVSDM